MSSNTLNENQNIWNETVTFEFDDGVNLNDITQTLTNTISNALNHVRPVTNVNTNPNNETVSETEEFDCSICKELLCEPLILMCQHAFCFDCIQRYNNKNKNTSTSLNPQPRSLAYNLDTQIRECSLCPICRFPFTLPPKYNQEFENLLSYQFPDEYKERKEMINVNRQRDDLEDNMRKEVWNMINKNPPIKDLWNGDDRPGPFIRPIKYPRTLDIADLDGIEEKGFFRSFFSNSIVQSVISVSIALPCALYMSRKLGLWNN
jgi:hypothetical protein